MVSDARLLQRSLLHAKQEGRFSELEDLLSLGKVGMASCIWLRATASSSVLTYQKAAGDKLVRYWCQLHLRELSESFDNNRTEAAVTKWLQLPDLVLRSAVAREVGDWNEHGLADFFETLAIYLPCQVLDMLMNVSVNFFAFSGRKFSQSRTCRLRNREGLLVCAKQVRPRYGHYCCYSHRKLGMEEEESERSSCES